MTERSKLELKNAVREIAFYTTRLDNPYDRVRVSEWVRKLFTLSDSSVDDVEKKNEYAQFLRIQVLHGILRTPFKNPPPDTDLPSLAQLLGNIMGENIPGLSKFGPISPAIVHTSGDGRAYISIQKDPERGVQCYLAVTTDGFNK